MQKNNFTTTIVQEIKIIKKNIRIKKQYTQIF